MYAIRPFQKVWHIEKCVGPLNIDPKTGLIKNAVFQHWYYDTRFCLNPFPGIRQIGVFELNPVKEVFV